MGFWKYISAAVIGGLALTGSAAQGPSIVPRPTAEVAATAPVEVPATATPAGAPVLDRANVESWLDGFMPYAIARGDIAGAVVVVVKDGQVLLQKGYGFSDVEKRTPVSPDATLFRPGSVSKLFTWTAVMQQVDQGKIDLDRDINAYLDFEIPPFEGKPITMRNLMTHTPGFEETVRYLIRTEEQGGMELEEYVRKSLPERIFAPGTTPAYSNYGTALAGYIVERVSGQKFDDYIERNIFQPLGMTRSSFRQPLPANLKPLMSKGYPLASAPAEGFEVVAPAPAGSLSSTGADLAKFMIAHLDDGGAILSPRAAQMMHDYRLTVIPPLNRMALGFYEHNINGRRVIAHAGDTVYFHSELNLFIDDNVGMFVSVNSGGSSGAAHSIRAALFQEFANRYFPDADAPAQAAQTASKEHAAALTGNYTSSRGIYTNFLHVLDLFGQATVGVTKDGGPLVPAAANFAGKPRKWVEIAPFVWRDVNSGEKLAAEVKDGKVQRWSFDTISPFIVFLPVPWYLNAAWLMPAALAALGIVLVTALSWPAGAIARRRFKGAAAYQGRRLRDQRIFYGILWLFLATVVGWAVFIIMAFSSLSMLSGPLDPLLYLVQILTPITFVGLVLAAAWNLWSGWKEKRARFGLLWGVLLLLASIIMLWVAIGFDLIGFGTQY